MTKTEKEILCKLLFEYKKDMEKRKNKITIAGMPLKESAYIKAVDGAEMIQRIIDLED